MIFRGKVRKTAPILADDKALERVGTFCYLGIVFRFILYINSRKECLYLQAMIIQIYEIYK